MTGFFQKHRDKLSKCIKKHRKLIFVLVGILSITFILFVTWIYTLLTFPQKEIYFSDSFNAGAEKWEGFDATLLDEKMNSIENKAIKLSAKQYAAPYLKTSLPTDEIPSDSFVYHFQVKPNSFTGDSITLASLIFSAEPIVIVADQNGKVGLSNNMFTGVSYSNSVAAKLQLKHWNDIYLNLDARNHKLILYVNGIEALSRTYEAISYPLKEIWLGTIWISGAQNYGAPLDISYDNVVLGNKGLLPKPGFIKFALNGLNSSYNFLKSIL